MNRFPRLFLALLVLIGIGFPIQERELEPMDWGPIMPFPADDPPDRHDNPQARAQWEYQRLRNPETGLIPKGIFRREHEFARKLPQRPDGEKVAGWVNRGPYNVGGRTRALGIDVTDPTGQTLLAGGVTGGLWRTVDDGASWTMLVGSSHLHHINCIAQDIRPGQENVWYYGTGEGQKTNLDSGQRYHRGDGIFKSIDGGLTWDVLPATATYLPQEFDNPFNYVGRIVVDVSNTLEDEVYAATYGIIYRSIDGGESWTPVLGDEDQLGKYTEITIDDQGVLFASISSDGGTNGVFRSPDGVTWANLGAPFSNPGFGRIALGVSPTYVDRVFVLVSNPTSSAISELWNYFYYSGDGSGNGGAWIDRSPLLTTLPNPYYPGYTTYFWPQRGYNLHVATHPTSSYRVFIGGVHLWRSTNAWLSDNQILRVGGYYYNGRSHHADQHQLLFQPGSSTVAYTASDGGVHKTLDINATTVTWTSLNNGYNTTQFYTVAVDQNVPGNPVVLGGTQDNGTLWTDSTDETADWEEIYGGDGAFCSVIDVATGHYLVSYYFANTLQIVVDESGALLQETTLTPETENNFLFINAALADPADEKVLYLASDQGVMRNSDFTEIPPGSYDPTTINWEQLTNEPAGEAISALGTNAQPGHALYYGTVEGGLFRVDEALTAPAGTTGVELTGNAAFSAGSWVTGIAVHPADDRKVLICSANYEVASLWYTDDGGSTWSDVEGNLAGADGPSVRCVAIYPLDEGDMWWAGTSVGLYSTIRPAAGDPVWVQESPDDIGNVIVEALTIRPADGLIAVATFGRGIFTTNYSPASPVNLPEAVGRLAQNVPNPFNPSTEIFFHLSEPGMVQLEVFDIRGQRVKTLVNEYLVDGDHRAIWDGRDQAGQQMASGTYLYRLQSGAWVEQKKMILLK